MPVALGAARVWGPRQRQIERAVGRLERRQIDRLIAAAILCDGIVKGLRRPDWPEDPWDALRRLVLLTASRTRSVGHGLPPGLALVA